MGTRTANVRPAGWQGSLAQMRVYRTRVMRTCSRCHKYEHIDLERLEAERGPDYMLWDKRPPCPTCGARSHFMASPGPSTPYRPLLSGILAEAERQAFLRSFGFTRRDLIRIKRMAETVTETHRPAALADLDVPFRIGACPPAEEARYTGQVLGEWAGRTLLYWAMNEPEERLWRLNRRQGPKPVP